MPPLAYLLTFSCHGHRLHGDDPYTVDRFHNIFNGPAVEANAGRVRYETRLLTSPPYVLDDHAREEVLEAIHDVCRHRSWTLLAAHVRTTHVHVVVRSDATPEIVMNTFKAYASRRLQIPGDNNSEQKQKRWARHGSTRYLWNEEDVAAAKEYVVNGQGIPMTLWWLREGDVAMKEPRP